MDDVRMWFEDQVEKAKIAWTIVIVTVLYIGGVLSSVTDYFEQATPTDNVEDVIPAPPIQVSPEMDV